MTETHRSKMKGESYTVTAWQFDKTKSIPAWVARKFHRINEEGWEAIAMDGVIVPAKPGDWVVMLDVEIAVVLTDTEFHKCFEKICV